MVIATIVSIVTKSIIVCFQNISINFLTVQLTLFEYLSFPSLCVFEESNLKLVCVLQQFHKHLSGATLAFSLSYQSRICFTNLNQALVITKEKVLDEIHLQPKLLEIFFSSWPHPEIIYYIFKQQIKFFDIIKI